MAPAKRKPRKSSAARKKKSTGVSKTYTILRKSAIDPKKKVSSQGKSCTTTKSGAYLAAKTALKKSKRPTRIYLYRKKRIMTYSITYTKKKDGKTKASAKLLRSKIVKRKKTPSKKKKTTKRKTKKRKRKRKRSTTTTASKTAKIAELKRKLVRLSKR